MCRHARVNGHRDVYALACLWHFTVENWLMMFGLFRQSLLAARGPLSVSTVASFICATECLGVSVWVTVRFCTGRRLDGPASFGSGAGVWATGSTVPGAFLAQGRPAPTLLFSLPEATAT